MATPQAVQANDDEPKKTMSERSPDIGRMIQEEIDKKKTSATGEKPLVDEPAESRIGDMIADSVKGVEGAKGDKPLVDMPEADDSAIKAEKEAALAKSAADLGAKAANKVQRAFESNKTGELAGVMGELMINAKAAGVDEASARKVLQEQLKLYHDTYKEAGLDAKAAEIDSFSRSLDNANEVSSEAGVALQEMIDAGAFESEVEANAKIDAALKSKKLLGTEVNILMDKVRGHFEAEKAKIQEETDKAGKVRETGFTDEDVDDALDIFSEKKAS